MERTFESRFKTKTGWLCLDFANTVDWHAGPNPEEKLSGYRDLVLWAKEVSIMSPATADALISEGENKPALAQETLNKAIELREAIYRILSSRSRGEASNANDLSILNEAIATIMPNQKLSTNNGNFTWDWTVSAERLDSILWPVVWSTAELLTSEAMGRVGQCADDKCGWLFWDSSRNRTRRWCDMKDCGNRAKSRRHYRRSHDRVE